MTYIFVVIPLLFVYTFPRFIKAIPAPLIAIFKKQPLFIINNVWLPTLLL